MRRTMVLIFLTGATLTAPPALAGGGGGCHDPNMTDAKTTSVEMIGACFSPTIVRVSEGETVNWVNRDGFAHVVFGTGWSNHESGAKVLDMGDSFSHRFDRAGIYPYSCFYHAGMNGAVVVGDGEQTVAVAAPKTASRANRIKPPLPMLASIGLPLIGINFGIAVAALTVTMRRRRA